MQKTNRIEVKEGVFSHFDLKLIQPIWDSDLHKSIVELEKLRHSKIDRGEKHMSSQIKKVFHLLENIGSAKIEGNKTTLADLVDKTIQGTLKTSPEEKIKMLANIDDALNYIDLNIVKGTALDINFINKIHEIVVSGLKPSPHGEGDPSPGCLRNRNVDISNSAHKPPLFIKVSDYMQELFDFINSDISIVNKLIVIALAHHRFVWIHPYINGNGRVVRLFTYAMLISQGFAVNRVINPTAVFCNDREEYCHNLGLADVGDDEGLIAWTEYVLTNLLSEMKKVDELTNSENIYKKILKPALNYTLEVGKITTEEYKVLDHALNKPSIAFIRASDVKDVLKIEDASVVSRMIRKMVQKKVIKPIREQARLYVVNIGDSVLLRGVIKALEDADYIPESFKDEIK